MKKEYDLVVIGAGSGGLTAAIGGAQIGAKVMLIEKEKIGGDCTHYGCIPSKTLIKASKVAKEIRNSKKYGLGKANVDIDLKNVLEKVQKTVKSVYSHETPKEISKLGIGVEIGSAKFLDKRCVEVNGKKVTSKKFIIATGSRARVPQIKGLSEIDYMTNRTIFSPKKYSSIAVLGGGPIGSELGQALSNLGVNVTIINNVSYIIPREDMDASMLVEKEMIRDRVKIYNNSSVYEIKQKGKRKIVNIENVKSSKIESIEVDEVLVAVGRVPNIEDLGLDEAGVLYNKRGVIVDSSGRSSNRNIYAIGDVAGGFQFTHLANSHGKSVLAKTIFKIPSKFERDVIPRVTFTIPQVGSVGINESQKDDSDFVLKLDYNKVDRAVTDSDTNGFYKIIVNRKGFIRGAVIVGEGAGELIGELAFAMKNMIKVTKLADTIHPYPTYAYGLRNCCDKFRAMFYNENKKKWVKRIFNLRG